MSLKGYKIGSKYVVGPIIGSGSFGQVYVVNQIGTSRVFALKKQDQKAKHSQQLIQIKVLRELQGYAGFSKVHWRGTENRTNIFIMDMLGPSLQDLFLLWDKKFSLKTILMLADQMIKRVQQLHSKNFIHRDIKPQNFLMGIEQNSHVVHLIDFGLTINYRDFQNQHIPYKQNKSMIGTARYASINTHLGVQQSRRDDLQAIGYVLLYLSRGYLPWQRIKANNKNEKYKKMLQKKLQVPIQLQFQGLPLQFSIYLHYCRALKFEEKPDYHFLRSLFTRMLQRNNHRYDYLYDWCSVAQPRTFTNQKIIIQIQGNQKSQQQRQLRGQALKQADNLKIKNKTKADSNYMSFESNKYKSIEGSARMQKIQPIYQKDQEIFGEGEQNFYDDEMIKQQIGAKVTAGTGYFDLEDKKNQLNYSDDLIDN